jgi:serine protease
MPRSILALFLLLVSAAASAQSTSTLCQAEPVPVFNDLTDRRLVGCGAGFPDNLLWNLDRSDSVTGELDRNVQRRLTGRGSVVYVLDVGGITASHQEFMRATGSVVIDGFNANGGAPTGCFDPLKPCASSSHQVMVDGHGTAVASVIAGKNTGIAPDASIVAVRVTEGGDEAWEQALKAVIAHAHAPTTPPFRTAVINMSSAPAYFESPRFEAYMRRMIGGVDADGNADPNGKRFLFVVLAGNTGPEFQGLLGHCTFGREPAIFPAVLGARVEGLITAAGLARDNELWAGSCFGVSVDVLAPAADILLASNSGDDRYRFRPDWIRSGTSYATPYVSAMAARLLESDPSLSPVELERRLKASASRVNGLPVPVIPYTPKRRSVR